MRIITNLLFILAYSHFAQQSAFAKSVRTTKTQNSISKYNLICTMQTTEILLNTFQFEVANRSTVNPEAIGSFETLLVEPQKECEHCLHITARSDENAEQVYVFQIRQPTTYRLDIYYLSKSGEKDLLYGDIECVKNSKFAQ